MPKNKVIKIYERPKKLPALIMGIEPGGTLTIYSTAFKSAHVRTAVCRINKKLSRKEFSVTDKGMMDRCVVSRI